MNKNCTIIIYSLGFFTSALADGLSPEFEWHQNSSSLQDFHRSLLNILTVLNNVVVWMVSTRPPTSKSSGPFSNPLVTVPNARVTIGITVNFKFHSFFNSLGGTCGFCCCALSSFLFLLGNLAFWPSSHIYLKKLNICVEHIKYQYFIYFHLFSSSDISKTAILN